MSFDLPYEATTNEIEMNLVDDNNQYDEYSALLGWYISDDGLLGEEEEEQDPGSGLSGDAIKGIMMAAIFVVCAVGAILPYFFKSGKKGKFVLSMGTAFGGGVFLSAGLMHLLPDAVEEFSQLVDSDYPYVELIVMFGFLLIFFIEYIAIDHSKHDQISGHDGHGHDHAPNVQGGVSMISSDGDIELNVDPGSPILGLDGAAVGEGLAPKAIADEGFAAQGDGPELTGTGTDELNSSLEKFVCHSSSGDLGDSKTKKDKKDKKKKRGGKITAAVDQSLMQYSSFTVIILLLALSVHAFLEGFGLGCQMDVSQMTVYFIAIILHKIVETFSLSVSVVRSPLSFRAGAIVNFILVMMTPVGIAVGMIVLVAVGEDSSAADWIAAIANSISAGTFLYVSICEVIMGEFEEPFDKNDKHLSKIMRWVNFLLVLVGIGVMSALALVC